MPPVLPQPPRLVCPLCGHDDDVSVVVIGPGLWRYTCSAPRHSPTHSWQTTASGHGAEPELGGKAEALGLYDDLIVCLGVGEPWIEYGVVEHRYSQRRPATYAQLVRDYGHTRLVSKPYTASVFIAAALTRLADRGLVCLQFREATGYWSYNEVISYWALPPPPPLHRALSYASFAADQGLDPDV